MNQSSTNSLQNHSISIIRVGQQENIRTRKVSNTNVVDGLGRPGQYTGCIDSQTGRPHGDGEMRYPNGEIYIGGWVNGDWSGYGKHTRIATTTGSTTTAGTHNSIIVYEGGFFDNLKHGLGVEHYPDGRIYDGTFQLGTMGKGQMSYPDGSLYWGYFSSNTSDDDDNNGQQQHLPHGRGKYTYADGSVYDGLFQDGIRHGHGRMTWNDGRWYLGEWVDGKRNGLGMEVMPDGKLCHEGTFCSDKAVTCSSFPQKRRSSDEALLYRASFAVDRKGARLVGPMPRRGVSMPSLADHYCRK